MKKKKTNENQNPQTALLRRLRQAEHRKQTEKRKRAEAQARQHVAQAWERKGHTERYKQAAVRETYRRTVVGMRDELFDGILLTLSPRYSEKSMSVQMRVLRRIAEKRQAQAAYRRIGRSDDLFTAHLLLRSGKRCMSALRRHRDCV